MAKLNFPTPNLNNPETLTYTDAGITWTWNNTLGVWSSDLSDIENTHWERTGTTLSPKIANDNVDIGTGTVTAGDGAFSGTVTGTFSGNLTGDVTGNATTATTATNATNAAKILRNGITSASTNSHRLLLGANNNNTGYQNCYVVTDRNSLYYQPSTNKLTCGSYAGSSTGAFTLGTLALKASTQFGIYDTTKRTQNNFGIIHSTEQDVCLKNSKGVLKLSDGGSIYLKTNSKSQILYIRTGTTKPSSTITGYASLYCSKAGTTGRISAETEFEMEGDDETKYEIQTIDHGDGYIEESLEYIGTKEKAITIIRELRNRCQTLELRRAEVDAQLASVMTRLAALEGNS